MIIGILKTGVGLAASLGVGSIVTNAIKATTPATINGVNKLMVKVGCVVVGSMIGDAVINHTNATVDGFVNIFRKENDEETEEDIEE